MAILRIAQMGHPVLRQVAEPVAPDRVLTPEFQRFCDDLLHTMRETDGVGLAAPQVHVSERVVVFELDEEQGPMFLINPIVTPIGEVKKTGYEGCLSVSAMRGRVERHDAVRVVAMDRDGTTYAFTARGWAARVVQHECDHLEGVLYIDRADPKSLAFLPEYRKYGPLLPADDDGDDADDGEDEKREE